MRITNKESGNEKVEIKPVDFSGLPSHILEKLLNQEKSTAHSDVSGYEQFDVAIKILSDSNRLEEGFNWLSESLKYNCQEAKDYISQKVYQIETTQNLTLYDFKWIKYAVLYNLEPAIKMVEYYSTNLNWNPILSLGIYLVGNKMVPQNIELSVSLLNNLVDSDNASACQLLESILFSWTPGDFEELYFLGAQIYFTGNRRENKDYLKGIEFLKKAIKRNSIFGKIFVKTLRENKKKSISQRIILGLILINSENQVDINLGNSLLKSTFKVLKKNEDDRKFYYELALCYDNGFGCKRNIFAARNMYKKLVKDGCKDYTDKYNELQKQVNIAQRNTRNLIIIVMVFFSIALIIIDNLKHL